MNTTTGLKLDKWFAGTGELASIDIEAAKNYYKENGLSPSCTGFLLLLELTALYADNSFLTLNMGYELLSQRHSCTPLKIRYQIRTVYEEARKKRSELGLETIPLKRLVTGCVSECMSFQKNNL